MRTITTGSMKKHTFEIVDKIPTGFFVWNIGDNMKMDEYIPLCEKLCPNDKDSYDINPATLKAIKLDPETVKILREAAHYGVTSKKAAEKTLKRTPKTIMAKRKFEFAKQTIEIFEKIS